MARTWNDRSHTSHLQDFWLEGVVGTIRRTEPKTKLQKVRFQLLINWMSPEDDPPTTTTALQSGLANSEALLSMRFPSSRTGLILPVRKLNGSEIGFTAEVLDWPEHADELGGDFDDLIGCRVRALVRMPYFRFEVKKEGKTEIICGYKLKVMKLEAEGVQFQFS